MLTELTFKRLNKQYNLSLNQSKLKLKQGFAGPGSIPTTNGLTQDWGHDRSP